MSDFSGYLRYLRKEKNLTQKELASILKVSLTQVKRIETGRSIIPNSKLLNDLSTLTGLSKVDVLENILFWDNDSRKEDPYKFGFNFLSYMYLNGWNLEPLKEYSPQDSDYKDTYLALITKKTKSMRCLVKMIEVGSHSTGFTNDEVRELLFNQVIKVASITDLQGINNYIYLCNNNNDGSVEVYKILKSFKFSAIKLNIKAVLYDADKNEVIDQSQPTGFNFVLKG